MFNPGDYSGHKTDGSWKTCGYKGVLIDAKSALWNFHAISGMPGIGHEPREVAPWW